MKGEVPVYDSEAIGFDHRLEAHFQHEHSISGHMGSCPVLKKNWGQL